MSEREDKRIPVLTSKFDDVLVAAANLPGGLPMTVSRALNAMLEEAEAARAASEPVIGHTLDERLTTLSDALGALIEAVAPVAGLLRMSDDPKQVAWGDKLRDALQPAREALVPGWHEMLRRHTAPEEGPARMGEGPVSTATGRVLTDADFRALADEAEAGYPIERLQDARVQEDDGPRRLLDAGWWVAYNGEGTEGWADGHAESGMLLLSRAEALARLGGTDA